MMSERPSGTAALTTEHYTFDAWGEHADTGSVPTTENKIRYAGSRVEFFANGSTQDVVYLCGERHYMPVYGRFFQRDRLTYERMPSPARPLTVNPYIYAENNPVMKKDLTGLQPAGYYRGATMGGQNMFIGTEMPPESQMYDCCASGYNSLSEGQAMMTQIHSTKLGRTRSLSWMAKRAGWDKGLCNVDPSEGQPNENCPDITSAPPDLLCTYLEVCGGISCPAWKHPGCPKGMAKNNLGGDTLDPRVENLGNGESIFYDSYGQGRTMPTNAAETLLSLWASYDDYVSGLLSDHSTGVISNMREFFGTSLPIWIYSKLLFRCGLWITHPDELSCNEMQDLVAPYLYGIVTLVEYNEFNAIQAGWTVERVNFLGDNERALHHWVEMDNTSSGMEYWSVCFDPWMHQDSRIVFILRYPVMDPPLTSYGGYPQGLLRRGYGDGWNDVGLAY